MSFELAQTFYLPVYVVVCTQFALDTNTHGLLIIYDDTTDGGILHRDIRKHTERTYNYLGDG